MSIVDEPEQDIEWADVLSDYDIDMNGMDDTERTAVTAALDGYYGYVQAHGVISPPESIVLAAMAAVRALRDCKHAQ